ncbi:DNA polymerase III subunit chi [Salinisphaera aquimarina]|uniref:DNA polymerase III subunit chi n=1 Tax=Salinisphaera aquimarina TaxID=2094031 RepID=A0ABV7ET07_9GAMM
MTEVFFYILEADGADALERFACRLTEKAHEGGHRVYLHAADADQVARLDKLLWIFRQGSFVPHCAVEALAADDRLTPVTIGSGAPPAGFDDVLINVGGDASGFFSRFGRHNELVPPAAVAGARSLYRFYKDRGYALTTHKIAAS